MSGSMNNENINSSMTTNQNTVQVPESKQEEAQLSEAEEAKLCQEFERQVAQEEANEDAKEASPTLQEENWPPSAEACIQLLIKIKSQLDKQHSENKDDLPSDQLFSKPCPKQLMMVTYSPP
jgi:hypothetical protein